MVKKEKGGGRLEAIQDDNRADQKCFIGDNLVQIGPIERKQSLVKWGHQGEIRSVKNVSIMSQFKIPSCEKNATPFGFICFIYLYNI